MNNEITVTVEGWLARAPQRYGHDEATWVVFRMGSTAWWKDSNGERKQAPTTWFDVKVANQQLADNVLLSLKTGDPVMVTGRLAPKIWTDRDGNERTTLQINARSVGPNLRWGKALFKRTQTDAPSGEAHPWESGAAPDAQTDAAGDTETDAQTDAESAPSEAPDTAAEAFRQVDSAMAAEDAGTEEQEAVAVPF